MNNKSRIGMGFLEKVFVILFPVVLGIVGLFFMQLLNFAQRIPFISDSKVFEVLSSFNSFWVSIVMTIIGLIIGGILSLTVYSEALKMNVTNNEIIVDKDSNKMQIRKSDVKEIFMEDRTIVITGDKGQELMREKTDIKETKIREVFLHHHYPWSEQDPYADEYRIWTLDDHTIGENVYVILYERRNAIREKDKKKVKNLREDLNEVGIMVKDQGGNQYIRTIHD